ncbi:MAG: Peptide methionine sulfoxide reductase MsrA 2 [Cyanobium sp. ARS6]|nr:MAG: Peptide methionine sulfoxide reductase MsrA 2 [Cyanobium sp. ARS6]
MVRFLLSLLFGALLLISPASADAVEQKAVLAGGCFWCMESDLEKLPGVISVESGYSGGSVSQPTYNQVSSETTGHQEVVEVLFDPATISYPKLLQSYWRNVDPLDGDGQFCDRGDSYRPVIFTSGEQQNSDALASQSAAAAELGVSESALKVEIKPLEKFWPAEDYHQNFAELNSVKYKYYRWACGRDKRLDAIWGDKARSSESWAK